MEQRGNLMMSSHSTAFAYIKLKRSAHDGYYLY